jgi:high-affinity nickel-transport protein
MLFRPWRGAEGIEGASVELASILTERFGIGGGPLAAVGRIDLNQVGYAIVGLFIVTWLIALAVWRYGNIERKWSAHLSDPEPASYG